VPECCPICGETKLEGVQYKNPHFGVCPTIAAYKDNTNEHRLQQSMVNQQMFMQTFITRPSEPNATNKQPSSQLDGSTNARNPSRKRYRSRREVTKRYSTAGVTLGEQVGPFTKRSQMSQQPNPLRQTTIYKTSRRQQTSTLTTQPSEGSKSPDEASSSDADTKPPRKKMAFDVKSDSDSTKQTTFPSQNSEKDKEVQDKKSKQDEKTKADAVSDEQKTHILPPLVQAPKDTAPASADCSAFSSSCSSSSSPAKAWTAASNDARTLFQEFMQRAHALEDQQFLKTSEANLQTDESKMTQSQTEKGTSNKQPAQRSDSVVLSEGLQQLRLPKSDGSSSRDRQNPEEENQSEWGDDDGSSNSSDTDPVEDADKMQDEGRGNATKNDHAEIMQDEGRGNATTNLQPPTNTATNDHVNINIAIKTDSQLLSLNQSNASVNPNPYARQ
jgi:hypothetical protein